MAVYSREFVSRFIISYGFYERHYIRELFKFLERKDVLTHEKTCLDIGANIGNHSVRFSQIFRQVYAFEPHPDISKYGVVVTDVSGSGIAGLVEKPEAVDAPSNLASIGRYVLKPDIFDTLRSIGTGSGGEIQLSDAINIHAQMGDVETVLLNGLRFDCGSVDGFMRASQHEYQRRQDN